MGNNQDIDDSVEQLELLNNDINHINFKLEGMTEDVERWEESMPNVHRRQIDLNRTRINRLSKQAGEKTIEKERLSAIVQSYQMDKQAEQKAKNDALVEKKAKASAKRKAKREALKAKRED